jgi:diguanylate cyclase (GGDEF)-like protein
MQSTQGGLGAKATRTIDLLLVDDDDADRETFRRLVHESRLTAKIEEVSSASEAIARLAACHFDCIVVEYRLGDTNGTDLVRRIKQGSDAPVAIIMVTSWGNERTVVEAMREGVHDYLLKDRLTAQDVADAIEESLRRAEFEAELVRAQQRLERLSMFDTLTNLPNRNLFWDRLEQTLQAAKRSDLGFTVMMMDVNLFKEINDTRGHEAGDKLLVEIGHRLSHLARASDTFARIGGDEFAALLIGCDSASSANVVAEKIQSVISEPVILDAELVRVTVSIGVVIFPHHGMDSFTILAHADQAMYRAKRSGRPCEIYSAGRAEARPYLIASQLNDAVDRKELFLQYQPKLHLGTGAVVGVEALARWRNPRLGFVLPNDFIPLAERSSFIKPMTYAILDMALDQAVVWRDQGWDVPVAVNLSARMFDDDELVARSRQALAIRGLRPEALLLEVTETALMTSPLAAQKALRALRDTGIAISIDDFGAGYTSLKYLRDFDISEIKIDKLFISSLDTTSRDVAIVRSIAALSRGFNVNLVAEGIEDEGKCKLLHQLGCDFGQGFALGRPMSAEKLAVWRDTRSWRGLQQSDPGSGTHTVLGARLGPPTGSGAA